MIRFRSNELRWILLVAAALAVACGEDPMPADPAAARSAAQAAPADAALARLYDQTCRSCHTNPAIGAPLSRDAKTWQPRLAQGEDVLLEHTVNGFKGMPPLGSCMDCSEDDFRALIRFMAGLDS